LGRGKGDHRLAHEHAGDELLKEALAGVGAGGVSGVVVRRHGQQIADEAAPLHVDDHGVLGATLGGVLQRLDVAHLDQQEPRVEKRGCLSSLGKRGCGKSVCFRDGRGRLRSSAGAN
jgi:hypothetical protein